MPANYAPMNLAGVGGTKNILTTLDVCIKMAKVTLQQILGKEVILCLHISTIRKSIAMYNCIVGCYMKLPPHTDKPAGSEIIDLISRQIDMLGFKRLW